MYGEVYSDITEENRLAYEKELHELNTDYRVFRDRGRNMVEAKHVTIQGQPLRFLQNYGHHMFDDEQIRCLIAGVNVMIPNVLTRDGKVQEIRGCLSLHDNKTGYMIFEPSTTELEISDVERQVAMDKHLSRVDKAMSVLGCLDEISCEEFGAVMDQLE